MQSIPMFILAATAVGGFAWVFIYPSLSGEKKAEKRRDLVARTGSSAPARTPRNLNKPRREQIEATLKQVEDRRAKSATLSSRIIQAGLKWSRQKFFIISGLLGLAAFVVAFVLNAGLPAALGFAFAAGCGLPRWLLKFLKKRREAKFLTAFRTRSTSSCAASRPACLSSRAFGSLPTMHPSRSGASSAPSSRRRQSASRSARRAPSCTSTFRCRRRISSQSSSPSSSGPEATSRRHSETFHACCVTARR